MKENNKDIEQYELEKIRMRKMRAIMEAQKRKQETEQVVESISGKIDYILKIVLAPEAYSHLNNLKSKEPHIYQNIFNELVSPDVIQNIDYLLSILAKRGGTVPRRIPLDAIIYLERKAKGIKSKIQVKRGDDIMDLSSFLSK